MLVQPKAFLHLFLLSSYRPIEIWPYLFLFLIQCYIEITMQLWWLNFPDYSQKNFVLSYKHKISFFLIESLIWNGNQLFHKYLKHHSYEFYWIFIGKIIAQWVEIYSVYWTINISNLTWKLFIKWKKILLWLSMEIFAT